jgi:hypothetical protein
MTADLPCAAASENTVPVKKRGEETPAAPAKKFVAAWTEVMSAAATGSLMAKETMVCAGLAR